METEEILKKIRDFADTSHGDQKRKYTPDRYIVHPVRVMEMLRSYTDDIAVLASALLHDILEDTPVRKNELYDFLITCMSIKEAKRTVQLVSELTDVFIKKDYPKWNRRKRKAVELERIKETSADAQSVKYADIIDNCSEIVRHDPDFAKVFLFECRKILTVIDKGNPELYLQAKELVEEKITELKAKRS